MSSKLPHELEKCEGKNKYTKNQVEKARGRVGRNRGKDLRMYYCDKCHFYHLTKKNR